MLGESSENVSSTNPIPAKPFKDELFIDDDSDNVYGDTDKLNADDMMLDEEGSGMGSSSKGTGVEDMESSGSGYGPDDEDAPTNSKNKEKPGPDSEDDEDEDIDDEDETDENNDFDKKPMKTNFPTTASTSTTSTTTTTAKNYDDEQVWLNNVLNFTYYYQISNSKNIYILYFTSKNNYIEISIDYISS